MKKIISTCKKIPFHLFVLPLLFMAGVYVEYGGLIALKESINVFLGISVALSLLYFVLHFFIKNKLKAAVTTTILAIVFLFFRNIQMSFAGIPFLRFLSHYKYYLPLIAIVLPFLLYKIKTGKQIQKTVLFFNTLFFVYLLMSVWGIARILLIQQSAEKSVNNFSELRQITSGDGATKSKHPDIWYLVFDGYPSSLYMKEVLHDNNNLLDSVLASHGFFIAQHSKSNYNQTAFSINGTLNMRYLYWIKHKGLNLQPDNFYRALASVKTAPVVQYLDVAGYKIINLSMFDFKHYPSIQQERFITVPDEAVLLFNTFWECYKRDIRWKFSNDAAQSGTSLIKQTPEKITYYNRYKSFTTTSLDSLKTLAADTTSIPRFIYAHVYLPHFPYFYNADGQPYTDDSLYYDDLINDKKRFRAYVHYAEKKMTMLVEQIFANEKKSPGVIIFQSDHGPVSVDTTKESYAFRNYTAFYFPDKNYQMLYDSISNVNTFRIVLNKYFNQQLPSLPDSSIYLR